MKYILAYYYDVPHSVNFAIEANNKKEAMKQARRLLKAGRFEGLEGHPNDTGYNERVYVGPKIGKSDVDSFDAL